MDVELFNGRCSLQNGVSRPEMQPRTAGSNPSNFILSMYLSSETDLVAKGKSNVLPQSEQ